MVHLFDGVARGDIKTLSGPSDDDLIKRFAVDGHRVVVDECATWYWQSEREHWDFATDFGPLRLPYDRMWIEYSMPRTGKYGMGSEMVEFVIPMRIAVLLRQIHRSSTEFREAVQAAGDAGTGGKAACALVESQIIVDNKYGDLQFLPGMLTMAIDDAGKWLTGWSHLAGGGDREGMSSTIQDLTKTAMLAVGMMNCKNVATESRTDRGRSIRKGRRKTPTYGMQYHVIKLPTPSSAEPRMTAKGPVQGVMPVHTVRGHFKTFTAERPLLGKHVGTYWWGWQARGNKDNGVVDKHYEVSLPARP